MGKRSLPVGERCIRKSLSAAPGEWARWQRRADELAHRHGRRRNLSAAIVADAHAARLLRHELREQLNAIRLTAGLMELEVERHSFIPAADARCHAKVIEEAVRSIEGKLADER